MAQLMLSRMRKKLSEAEGYLLLNLPMRALDILNANEDWATMKFEACLLQGEALRMMDQYREALKPLEAAIALRPGDMIASVALGWCYKRTHRLAQAIDVLTQSLRKNPTVALLHYNLACYWSLAGETQQALNYLADALKLDADYVELIPAEGDFDSIRHLPQFERIVEKAARIA